MQKLAKLLYGIYPDEVKKFGEESLQISEDINYLRGIANSYNIIGTAHMLKGEWEEAIKNYETCLAIAQNENYTDLVAACYYNIGIVRQQKHEYAEALKSYLKALRVREQLNDVKGIAHVYNSIGTIYSIQNDYKNALQYFRKYLEMSQQHNLERGIEHAYNNMGIVHRKMKEYPKALEYSFKALELRQKNGIKLGVSDSYLNIGGIYEEMKDYSKALDYYQKSLELKRELNDNVGIGSSLLNISSIYYQTGKLIEAEKMLKESLSYSQQNQDLEAFSKIYFMLYQIDSTRKDYLNALIWYKKYHTIQDSLEKKHNLEMLTEIKTKFEADKKESQNKILREELRRKSVQNFTLFLGLVTVFVFSIYTYKNWQKLKEINLLLEIRNREVDAQKEEIRYQSEKLKEAHEELKRKNEQLEYSKEIILNNNRQITSSINYALYIQQAMLPRLKDIREALPQSFVFLRPRDIVSGDFYWFKKTAARPIFEEKSTFKGIEKILIGFENEKIIIAAADCTGHGVPGAFMSLIGNDLLNEIVDLKGIYSPEKVLNELKIRITYALNQHETLNNDGMEIAICVIDKEANVVEYAGSKMPLVYIQNNELTRLKGDNILIGGLDKILNFSFQKHIISIASETVFYMFSDGFQDQFGGEKRKKFKTDRLLSLLYRIHQWSVDEQLDEIQNV
ncbi:MAG: tetratricopeptide repeat protein, partial [Candidatus Calescibacterium sp.]|nr:tetratricopeptide repeat protein [Candidatus Calescibacterium sp.]